MPATAFMRFALATMLGVALAGVAAFSAAQTPAASDAATAPSPPRAAGAPIALILPLEAPAYARAADAVRAGFLAAAEAANAQAQVKVYAHGEDGVLSAFEAAREAGATVIVGPLLRDDLRTVAQLALALPNTIALNQLDDAAADAPANLYTFALAIEGDARAIARRVRSEGVQNVVVVNADSPLLRRFAGAFAAEWLQAGGSAPPAYRFEATPDALNAMRRELNRKPPGAALLALDSASATLAKPYLGTIPVYASGLVFERETVAVARDLDGIFLMEIPWIITPNAPQFANLPKREFPSSALTRLYALGLDAFRIAEAFREGAPDRFALDGATGQVSLGEGRQFVREGRLGLFRAGQLAPLDAPR